MEIVTTERFLYIRMLYNDIVGRDDRMTSQKESRKIISDKEIEFLLGGMVEKGQIREDFDSESNELVYSLLQKGRAEAEELLRISRTARLYLLCMHMNLHDDPHSALLEMAKRMKYSFNINLFQDVVEGIKNDEIRGIEIEDADVFVDLYNKI